MSILVNRMAERAERADAVRDVGPNLWRRLAAHRGFRIGAGIGIALALIAIIGPFFVGDPTVPNYRNQLAPPSGAHWLGTDGDGRDVLARTIDGAGVSYRAALLVFALTTAIGLALGVPAGLFGGWFDTLVSRVCDVMLGLPSLVLALAVVGALGPGFGNLILAMSLTGWAGLTKLSRALAMGARHRLDVVTAQMAGISRSRIAFTHILPGVFAQSLIASTLGLGETILGLAGLSFLGLGVQPPVAEWGKMLAESRMDLSSAPWLLLGPGLGLILTVTCVTLISDALRDCTDLREVG